MALYHLAAQIIARSAGRSATGAAAYRAGAKIADERTGLVFDFSRRRTVDRSANIILAPDGSPPWVFDRSALWNRAEAAEKRKDAQVARELELALPVELSAAEQMALVCDFAHEQFVSKWMIADITRHANPGNPHAHILLTMRLVVDGQFSAKKERSWNDAALLQEWREAWAKAQNQAFERRNIIAKVDHRSLLEQGVDRIPQRHIGPLIWNMAKRGLAWAKEVVHEKTGRSGGDTAEFQQEERRRAGIDRVQTPARTLDYASFRNLFFTLAQSNRGRAAEPVDAGALCRAPYSELGARSSDHPGMDYDSPELPKAQGPKRSRGI